MSSELALVRRAQRGDKAAFSELVRSHQDRVYTLARSIVRSPDDAADVTQETFLAALRTLHSFRHNAQFSTWLHRIALNKAYDLMRRRARDPEPVDPAGDASLLGQVAPADEQLRQRRALVDAIGSLDREFREAAVLVDVLGASIEEAAETLGVPQGTIKSRVFRARRQLADILGTYGYGKASKA